MITLWVGARGSGKTTAVVKKYYELCGQTERPLVTNIAFSEKFWRAWRGGRVRLSPDQTPVFWRHCPAGSYVAIDEVQVIYNSRSWNQTAKVAPDLLEYLSHSRKSGDEIDMLTQEVSRIDTQIRTQADVLADVNSTMWIRRVTRLPIPFDLVWVKRFVGTSSEDRIYQKGDCFFARKYYKYFDSYSCAIVSGRGFKRGSFANVEGNGVSGGRGGSPNTLFGAWLAREAKRRGLVKLSDVQSGPNGKEAK